MMARAIIAMIQNSYFLKVCVRVWFGTVLFAGLNSYLLMPTVLSVIGPVAHNRQNKGKGGPVSLLASFRDPAAILKGLEDYGDEEDEPENSQAHHAPLFELQAIGATNDQFSNQRQ